MIVVFTSSSQLVKLDLCVPDYPILLIPCISIFQDSPPSLDNRIYDLPAEDEAESDWKSSLKYSLRGPRSIGTNRDICNERYICLLIC